MRLHLVMYVGLHVELHIVDRYRIAKQYLPKLARDFVENSC